MIVDKIRVNKASIYLIDTLALGNARAVACYLLVDEKVALIDMGYASSKYTILDDLRSLNLTPMDIDYLIPTHLHLDHYGSLGYLAMHSNAEIVAHARAVKHMLDPSKLISSVKQVFGEHALDTFGYPMPVDASKSIRSVDKGKEYSIDLGSIELTCMDAEGHAPHQIAVYINASTALIATADSVSMLYPNFPYCFIPTTPPPSFDYKKYIETVNRLRAFDAKILLMPHFGISDKPSSVFNSTLASIDEWVSLVQGLIDDINKKRVRGEGEVRGVDEQGIDANTNLTLKILESSIINYVSSTARVTIDSIPEYVKNSIRNSVKGIYSYLINRAE
jgi:glyoxylase-like metal-dependent hydrolase (beta-lactamase superfamily II)